MRLRRSQNFASCLAGLVSVAVSTMVLCGCNFAEGIKDVGGSLGAPDSALIDAPGRQLAAGSFRKITVDGSLDEGGKIVALSDDEDGRHVVVIPYPHGDACQIAPALDFERISSRIDVELPGLFAVQQAADGSGRGKIDFVGFDCKAALESVDDAKLPRVLFPSEKPRGLLIIDGHGTLSMIIPGEDELVEVSTEVSLARTSPDYIFATRRGKLEVFGKDLESIASIGSNVVDFFPQRGKQIAVALLDDDGLSVWNEATGLVHLSQTACMPSFWGVDILAYYDPCSERRLQVYMDRRKLGFDQDGQVILDGPSGMATLDRRNLTWGAQPDATELSLLLAEQPQLSGSLVVATIPEDANPEASHISLETTPLGEGDTTFLGSEILTEYSADRGTLVELVRDEEGRAKELTPLARDVVRLFGGNALSPRGILANFDGVTGDLVVLEAGSESTKPKALLSGVPNQIIETEPETSRWIVLADSKDGHAGTLYLSRDEAGPLKEIASDVLNNSARFLEQPRGVAYLSGRAGTSTASLRVYLIESGLTVTIHKHVDEYRTLPWPSPGILYSVASGEDQGLWYAKAR